jgi:hypothetical protein
MEKIFLSCLLTSYNVISGRTGANVGGVEEDREKGVKGMKVSGWNVHVKAGGEGV